MSRSSPDAAPSAARGLPIGAVSARTGVSVPVLRSWEQRFGFPSPARLAGGHRRYTEHDVAQISRVVEERASGRSLEAAIEIAQRAATAVAPEPSTETTIFAAVRRRRPDVEPQTISRRAMLAISHAIEDECLARGERATLTAAFQTTRAYELGRPRWRLLTRGSASAVVFADFDRSLTTADRVHRIAIPSGAPLEREWAVVCDAPLSAAMLAGWERADGRFEAVWTVEPDVVRLATVIGRRLAGRHAPELALPEIPSGSLDAAAALRRATTLTNRAVAYLDHLNR